MRIDAATIETLRPWFPALDLDGVRIVESGPVCWFVRRVLGQGAMAVSPYIFYGRSRFDAASLGSLALLAHELKHVQQYRELGHLRFLLRYVRGLAGNRFRYSRELPLEAEAYALQAQVREALLPLFPPTA
jgi:hypothetical protein